MRPAIARVEHELARRARKSAIDHVGREQNALAIADGIPGPQAEFEQPLAHPRPAHLDPDLGQDAFGLVQHSDDHLVGNYMKRWAHGSIL